MVDAPILDNTKWFKFLYSYLTKIPFVSDDKIYLGLDGARCLVNNPSDGNTCQDYEVRFFCNVCVTECCHSNAAELMGKQLDWIKDIGGLMAALKYM